MTTITPTTLAEEIGTDAKTVRKFLRSEQGLNSKVGKGARWAIERKAVPALKRRFAKWAADEAQARADRAAAKAVEARTAAAEAPEVDDEAPATDEVEGPTDAELEALEADAEG